MTALFENLLDNSLDEIKHSLPENYEVDDVDWDDAEDIFQIPVFDTSTFEKATKGPVDRFRFYRLPGESDEQLIDRWDAALHEFTQRW